MPVASSPLVSCCCSQSTPVMLGCSTARIDWPPGWLEMAKTEPVHIEETGTAFTISWKGHNRLDGPSFVYSDRETRRDVTIFG